MTHPRFCRKAAHSVGHALSAASLALALLANGPTAAAQSVGPATTPAPTEQREITLERGERWFGGLSADGYLMPYSDTTTLSRNLYADNRGNQATPLLISSHGRYVWSEEPIAYGFQRGKLSVSSFGGPLIVGAEGETLPEVYRYVSHKYFPPSGKTPAPLLFTQPQYNTWIELTYYQEEAAILAYAQAIIDHGYPPGVLMIDDTWQEGYGDWRFDAARFPHPKAMVDRLHALGFEVMLWVCPFVSADSEEFRELAAAGLLLLDGGLVDRANATWRDTRDQAALVRWWNGASGLLDLSNPAARTWFDARLRYLVDSFGIDGFKLDAGDSPFYAGDIVSFTPSTPADHSYYFGQIGLDYPLNEYRASWKSAGLPLVQRLRDKTHEWSALRELVPGAIAQGLMGYAFVCPDMIGGGEYRSFLPGAVMDEELVVRSAQVHALMPMMQFSVAPWRILSADNNAICLAMAKLHSAWGERIFEMAEASAKTGEPIARALEYNYPDQGYVDIVDQFMLGTDLLVAPVTERGARRRKVVLPRGTWRADDGTRVVGPRTIEVEVPLARLPYFERIK